uniref:DUF3456 domain-containing protein n=1 Tax=Glossina pallidipes TaxID=7398 RepID=A0A1A9ZP75_GLOPL
MLLFRSGCSSRDHVELLLLQFKVCKVMIKEMTDEEAKVGPYKIVEIGGFRLHSSRNAVRQKKSLEKSELFLTELMEKCDNARSCHVNMLARTSTDPTFMKRIITSGIGLRVRVHNYLDTQTHPNVPSVRRWIVVAGVGADDHLSLTSTSLIEAAYTTQLRLMHFKLRCDVPKGSAAAHPPDLVRPRIIAGMADTPNKYDI